MLFFSSTTKVHLVNKAAIAPNAARAGAINAPTAPAVKGNSATISPFSSFVQSTANIHQPTLSRQYYSYTPF